MARGPKHAPHPEYIIATSLTLSILSQDYLQLSAQNNLAYPHLALGLRCFISLLRLPKKEEEESVVACVENRLRCFSAPFLGSIKMELKLRKAKKERERGNKNAGLRSLHLSDDQSELPPSRACNFGTLATNLHTLKKKKKNNNYLHHSTMCRCTAQVRKKSCVRARRCQKKTSPST